MATTLAEPFWLESPEVFLECLKFPGEMAPNELREALALHVEASSPFPLDQLYWAFFRGSGGRVWLILVHAGSLGDLRDAMRRERGVLHRALAGVALFEQLGGDESMVVDFGGFCLLIHCADPSDSLPQAYAFPLQSLSAFASSMGLDPGQIGKWEFEGARSSENNDLELSFSGENRGRETVTLKRSVVWDADLRDEEDKAFFARSARRMKRLGDAARVGLAAILLALLGYAAMFYFSGVEERRQADLEVLAGRAQQVDEAQELVLSLRQVGQDGVSPFHVLAVLNQVRPAGVHLTEAYIESPNRLIVSGRSNSVASVNAFVRELGESPVFSQTRPSTSSRAGEVSFDLRAEFSPGAISAGQSEEEGPADEVDVEEAPVQAAALAVYSNLEG